MKTAAIWLAVAAGLLWAGEAGAQCPSVTIRVDNDIAGSGYSEVNAKNWLTYKVAACHQTYRYLSHTVGDGTRKGKAIWKPKISTTGWYSVEVSYRATTNRSTDADYIVYDDNGGTKRFVINQKANTDCTKKNLGSYYCKAGGNCKVVLDGTDDSQSDCADMTTFKLVKCSGPPPTNPCGGISATKNYELCSWTATSCAGVYTNGVGCTAYCAAANMVCKARFGGDPGCVKETTTYACSAVNGHKSNWCECVALPKKDSGVPPPDKGPPPPDKSAPPVKDKSAPPPVKDRSAPPPAKDKSGPPPAKDISGKREGGVPVVPDPAGVSGGCAVVPTGSDLTTSLLVLATLFAFRRRKQ